jgi:hypothetical protein
MNITLTDILKEVNEIKLKIVGIIIFLGISGYVLYLAASDPTVLISKTYVYLFAVIIPLLIALYLLIGGNFTTQTFYAMIGILVFLVLMYVYISTDISKNIIIVYFINIVVFIIIFIGLVLISNLLSNNLKRQEGWVGFITNLIFYVPCLFNDFIGYILKDYYSTPQIFITLFIVEIILVLVFIYALPAVKSYIKGDSVQIQGDPVFLNQFTALDSGTVKTFTTNTMTVEIDVSGNKIFAEGGNNNLTNVRANYSLSMWVFLNPPNTSRIPIDSESNIFYYGSVYAPKDASTDPVLLDNTASGTSFHPQITYAIDSNKNGFYKIYVDTHRLDAITIDTDTMPYQKWNNIVLTYNQNTVDIFINGTLVRSKNLSVSPMFSNYDIMGIGTDASSFYATTYKNTDKELNDEPTLARETPTLNRNGLYGSVCNVMYYPTPLDRGKIATNYNYLVVKSIPIF